MPSKVSSFVVELWKFITNLPKLYPASCGAVWCGVLIQIKDLGWKEASQTKQIKVAPVLIVVGLGDEGQEEV